MEYSKQIADILTDHMEEQGYKYEFDPENGLIRANFKIGNKLGRVRFIIGVKDTFYVCYGRIDMSADESCRKEMVEFITRANYGLYFGNFEMDMEDGEIRYKCTVDCDHCTLSTQMIENSLNVPIAMFIRYGDGILKVMFGMETAEEAIRAAEN